MSNINGNTLSKKNKGILAIGIIQCTICLIGLIILLISVISAVIEKNRLEELGATVALKGTIWLALTIIGIIVFGIVGIVFISLSRKSLNASTSIENVSGFDSNNDFTETFNSNSSDTENVIVNQDIYIDSPINAVKKRSGLKSTMNIHINSEENINIKSAAISNSQKSDEDDNGFFSIGDDL